MLEIAASIFVAKTFPIEPTVVNVEVATFQMLAGIAAMEAPIEVDAVRTCALVFAFTTAAIDVEALPVVAFTSATTDDDAFVTSDCVASEPEVSPAPVRVRVATLHTSAASVPKDESVRDV